MKEIKLTQGKVTQVSDEDYEYLNQFRWYYNNGYATRCIFINGAYKREYMHRIIMGNPDSMVDHINRDRLNNLRSNLRLATRAQNRTNSISRVGIVPYKGVTKTDVKHNRRNPFLATIKLNRIKHHIGYYPTPELAAAAYNQKALEYYGDYARVNIIEV